MLSIGTKKYRNLQEQVGYNTECIKKLDEYLDGITIEDKLVVIESDSGTFTDEELVILSGPLAFISNGSRVWMKDSETLVQFVYKAIDIKATEVGSTYFDIGGSKIVVNRENGSYNTVSDNIITTYNKLQIDSFISNLTTVKANQADLVSGLAGKANISGQAFTGGITAPSIIETMSGYSFTNEIPTLNTVAFAGAVKTGNKLTIVMAGKLIPDESGFYSKYMGSFTVPAEVASKIYPINANNDVARVTAYFGTGTYTGVSVNGSWFKNGSTKITMRISGANLVASTEYDYRLELTLLLSDSLAS